MLHHIVPDEVAVGSLQPNLAYYEPRTAHGSSLSPGIHAGLLARAGRADEALDLLRLVARLDLDDITGSTAGGLHLAAMGSLWQALAFGFAGLRLTSAGIALDPHLPHQWRSLTLRIQVRGNPVRVTVRNDSVDVSSAEPVAIALPAGAALTMSADPG